MPRLASWLIALALTSSPACTDDGVIGSNDVAGGGAGGGGGGGGMDAGAPLGCVPACEADEVCDLASGRCVECADGTDCEAPDECDDCAVSDVACMATFCTTCTTDDDCGGDEPICSDGVCIEIDL